MARCVLVGLGIVLALGTAHAGSEQGAIVLGPYGYGNQLDGLAISVTRGATRMRIALSITVSASRSRDHGRPPAIKLTLPSRARVVGLAHVADDGTRTAGVAEGEGEAWQRFVDHVYASSPAHNSERHHSALLRFRYSVKGAALYEVGAAAVEVGKPVTLEIEIEIPIAPALVVKSGVAVANANVAIDGAAAKSVAIADKYKPTKIVLPKRTQAESDEAPAPDAVGDDVSLIAEPAAAPSDETTILAETRAQGRASLAGLRACFPKPTIMWIVKLTFTVARDGRATDVGVSEGDFEKAMPDPSVCVAGEVSAWHFTKPANPTPVTYHFYVTR